MGEAGAGKTIVTHAMANAFIKKYLYTFFASATKLVNDCLAYHTTFNETKTQFIEPYFECDVLIIDDLGMELKKRNFTLNILTSILDERMHAGKHTFISTNYSLKQLQEEYTDKVFSRMANAKNTLCIQTVGRDIRLSI